MTDIKTLLAEMFGFQLFVRDEELEIMIDETLNEYDDDVLLSLDALGAAAGGFSEVPRTGEGSDK